MSDMSDYLENAMYNHVLRHIPFTSPPLVYVALHTEDPGEDALGLEVSGGAYQRQVGTFEPPTNGSGTNTNLITFPEASSIWGMLTHFSLWDAVSGGNMLEHKELDIPKLIGVGDVFKFKPGQITASFQ